MTGIEAKVTSKGQITLPATVRRRLNVGPGDHVVFVEDAEGKIVMKARTGTLGDMRGILSKNVKIHTKANIEAWIDEARSRAFPSRGRKRRVRR